MFFRCRDRVLQNDPLFWAECLRAGVLICCLAAWEFLIAVECDSRLAPSSLPRSDPGRYPSVRSFPCTSCVRFVLHASNWSSPLLFRCPLLSGGQPRDCSMRRSARARSSRPAARWWSCSFAPAHAMRASCPGVHCGATSRILGPTQFMKGAARAREARSACACRSSAT